MPLLLCDLDDTLVDRERIIREWADEFAAGQQAGITAEWLVEIDQAGLTSRERFWAAIKERARLQATVPELVTGWELEFPARYGCDESVVEALSTARARGWRIAIITNGKQLVQQRKVAAAGLDELVDAVCISGAEGFRKPDPRLFAIAAKRAQSDMRDGWMIGDNPEADIGGAQAAGVRSIWLSRRRPWPRQDFRPEHESENVADAIRLVVGRGG